LTFPPKYHVLAARFEVGVMDKKNLHWRIAFGYLGDRVSL
jgi:hypothetical protein